MESHHEKEFASAFRYHANEDVIPINTKENVNLIKDHSNKNCCRSNTKKSLVVKRRWDRRKVVFQSCNKSLPVGIDSLFTPITYETKHTECFTTSSRKKEGRGYFLQLQWRPLNHNCTFSQEAEDNRYLQHPNWWWLSNYHHHIKKL